MLFEQVYIRLCASFLLVIGTCKVNILARCESPILMKFGTNVVFEKKKFDVFLLLSKLLKIPCLCKLMKLAFFNDEFNGVYHFAKKLFI